MKTTGCVAVIRSAITLLAVVSALGACSAEKGPAETVSEGLSPAEMAAAELLATLTLEQKVGQMIQGEISQVTPEDLRNQTLLHGEWRMERDVGANWRLWLRAAGLGDIDAGRGMRFNMESLLVQAAIDGLGVALMPESLVAGDISAGRLVRPFGNRHEIAPEFSAFIVYPPSAENNPNVVAFRDWALGEVRP